MSVKYTYEEQTYSLPCSIFHWLCIGFFSYLALCISNFQPSLPFRVYFSLLRKSISLLLCVFYFSLFFFSKNINTKALWNRTKACLTLAFSTQWKYGMCINIMHRIVTHWSWCYHLSVNDEVCVCVWSSDMIWF